MKKIFSYWLTPIPFTRIFYLNVMSWTRRMTRIPSAAREASSQACRRRRSSMIRKLNQTCQTICKFGIFDIVRSLRSRMGLCYCPGTTTTTITTSPKSCSFAHWRRPFLLYTDLLLFRQIYVGSLCYNKSTILAFVWASGPWPPHYKALIWI